MDVGDRRWLSYDYRAVDDLNDLSRTDGVSVFHYCASDTVGSIEYRLVERGIETEHLRAHHDHVEIFDSSRETARPDLDEVHGFVHQVCGGLDVYLPSISGEYFVGYERPRTGTWRVRNPGLTLVADQREITTVPPFDTVDYIWADRQLPGSPCQKPFRLSPGLSNRTTDGTGRTLMRWPREILALLRHRPDQRSY